MSHNNNDPSRGVAYDPLPLTQDDHLPNTLYNAPPSPDLTSTFHTPQTAPGELGPDTALGGAQPRFLGAALYDGPGSPVIRDSFASSQHTFPGSEYNASVYALNDPSGPARYDGSYRDDPRDSYYAGEHGGVPMSQGNSSARMLEEKRTAYEPPQTKSRRKIMILGAIAALILIILAIIVPLYFAVFKKSNNNEASSSQSTSKATTSSSAPPTSSSAASPPVRVVTGGDGSIITMEDGTTFEYKNPFGGYWYWDENDPFNNGARAQSWTPALNETFNYGVDRVRGSPALYQKYSSNPVPPVDEWTLSQAMRADVAGGGISQMETHYKTFITEKDFADVAGAGLNYVRIPIGWWAIEVRDDEPFLPKVSWTYFLKAIKWARKYGLRINLDLHAVPGSQNGWNHSGRFGTIGFLSGPMGYANAQRTLDYIRILAEFISQPQYKDVVTMFGILNEPQETFIGQDVLSSFYLEAYDIVRTAGGTGAGNGPYISLHDGFLPRDQWANFLPNADRLSLDSHPYLCFGPQSNAAMSTYALTPCQRWGSAVNNSMAAFGHTNAGEFSNAVTDCGLFLNGVGLGTRYEGDYDGVWPRMGSCRQWTDWQNYDEATKRAIRQFALASMDALQDYFFWTWKIGNSSVSGVVETPAWSYQLGLQQGWMPTDPREATGVCGNTSPWTPPLKSWQTGGANAGNIPSSVRSSLAWPPASFKTGGAVASLPSYTPTGPIPTLPGPTFSPVNPTATIDVGNGWANSADTQGMHVPISTCSYPDPWVNPSTAPPPMCGAGTRRETAPRSFNTDPLSS
ncbi:putative glucan 1,3-beta-glucosidase D [Psilocybe cubensis]|uniref:glucan 1,3-beta-glucosidase n=2 Tax=Psilocybe cubensis TaxID=181762 RepID=A0A8H7Y126_PSICU|nr:putative glucan 1,3-beta-glucosidase D [Psilocybe cubensis]KAH9484136.1 putative glucan 1,3-beta-glucosidase D [Psilocybe cubensis]